MVGEIIRFGPEIMQARELSGAINEIEVGRPIVGVQPDEKHKKNMRMRIERLCQHVFDKAGRRKVVLLAIKHGKTLSTFHKAAADLDGRPTRAQGKSFPS